MRSIPEVCQAMNVVFEREAPALGRDVGLSERGFSHVKLASLFVLGWWQKPAAGPSALARFAWSLGGRCASKTWRAILPSQLRPFCWRSCDERCKPCSVPINTPSENCKTSCTDIIDNIRTI
jgi:hypothetical protein